MLGPLLVESRGYQFPVLPDHQQHLVPGVGGETVYLQHCYLYLFTIGP